MPNYFIEINGDNGGNKIYDTSTNSLRSKPTNSGGETIKRKKIVYKDLDNLGGGPKSTKIENMNETKSLMGDKIGKMDPDKGMLIEDTGTYKTYQYFDSETKTMVTKRYYNNPSRNIEPPKSSVNNKQVKTVPEKNITYFLNKVVKDDSINKEFLKKYSNASKAEKKNMLKALMDNLKQKSKEFRKELKNELKNRVNNIKAKVKSTVKKYAGKFKDAMIDELMKYINQIKKIPEPVLLGMLKSIALGTEIAAANNSAMKFIGDLYMKSRDPGIKVLGARAEMFGRLATGLPQNVKEGEYLKADPLYAGGYVLDMMVRKDYALVVTWLITEYQLNPVTGLVKNILERAPKYGSTRCTLLYLEYYKSYNSYEKYKEKAYEMIKKLLVNGKTNFNFPTISIYMSINKIKPSAFGTLGCPEYKKRFMFKENEVSMMFPVVSNTLYDSTFPKTSEHVPIFLWMLRGDFSFMNDSSTPPVLPNSDPSTVEKVYVNINDSVIFDNKLFICGDNGMIAYSKNCLEWDTPVNILESRNINAMCKYDNVIIVGGDDGYINIIRNENSWDDPIKLPIQNSGNITSIYTTNGYIYFAFDNGSIYYTDSLDNIETNFIKLVDNLVKVNKIKLVKIDNIEYTAVCTINKIFLYDKNMTSILHTLDLSSNNVTNITNIEFFENRIFILYSNKLCSILNLNYDDFRYEYMNNNFNIYDIMNDGDKLIVVGENGYISFYDDNIWTDSIKPIFDNKTIRKIMFYNNYYIFFGVEGYISIYNPFISWNHINKVLYYNSKTISNSNSTNIKDYKTVRQIKYIDDTYYIIGDSGLLIKTKSLDNIANPIQILGKSDLKYIIKRNEFKYVFGTGGLLTKSKNCIYWDTAEKILNTTNIDYIYEFNNNIFVYAGNQCKMSNDMINWESISINIGLDNVVKIINDGNRHVVITRKGKVIVLQNLTQWLYDEFTNYELINIDNNASNGKKLVFTVDTPYKVNKDDLTVLVNNSVVSLSSIKMIGVNKFEYIYTFDSNVTSVDFKVRIVKKIKEIDTKKSIINDVIYFDEYYILVGTNGFISYSRDLINWNSSNIFKNKNINKIFNIDKTLYIVGEDGLISRTKFLSEWTNPKSIHNSKEITDVYIINTSENNYKVIFGGVTGSISYATLNSSQYIDEVYDIKTYKEVLNANDIETPTVKQKRRKKIEYKDLNSGIDDVDYDRTNRLAYDEILMRLTKNNVVILKPQQIGDNFLNDIFKDTGVAAVTSTFRNSRSLLYKAVKNLVTNGLI